MSVVWRRLTLAGFGRFEGEVAIELGEGLNVLVAPNESGKSTLAAGLAAVLFGLPASSDPEDFGQARWRNWRRPPRFEGELVFSARGKTYRIRRRFEDHAVRVSERTADGWRDILVGTHNPQARRRNERYEAFLAETVGLLDAKLFMQTFSVTQPLPATRQLDGTVQQLLSGAGAAQVDEALKVLEQQAKSLTKRTGSLGVTPRDGLKDGELEALEQRIAELRASIEASRQAVDERQAVQERLAALQEEMRRLQGEIERVEADADVWKRWQALRDEHRRALHEQAQLERAWETYSRRAQELEELRRRIAQQYPEMAAAPARAGELLDELQRLEDELSAKRRELRAQAGALQRRGAELAAEWSEFVARRERWLGARRRLGTEFDVFERADDATRRLCERYAAVKEALELRVYQTRRELEAAQAALERLEAERARFRSAFGDLESLGDEAAAAVDERLQRLEEKQRLQAALEKERARLRRSRLWQVGSLTAIATSFIVGAVGSYLDGWPLPQSLLLGLSGVSLLLLVLTSTIPRLRTSPEAEALAAQLRAVEEALDADQRLGPFKDAPPYELGALKQRLLARREAAIALAQQEAAVPGHVEELAERWRRAAAEYERFLAATSAARERFGDGLEDAYRRWNELRQEAARLEESLRAFSRRHFGQETVVPEELVLAELPEDGLAAVWRALGQLAADAGLGGRDGAAPLTVGDVAAALPRLAEADLAAAAAAREARDAELAALKEAIAALAGQLQSALEAAGGDAAAAKRRWLEYQQALAAAAGIEKELAGVLAGQGVGSSDELHVRSRHAANVAMDAYRLLQELAERHPFLPRPEDGLDGVDARVELQRLAARRDELKRLQRETEEQLVALRLQLADLTGRQVVNVAAALEELQALEQRRDALARQARVVALAFGELRAAAESFRETHRERLAARASYYVQRFSGRARRVVLDEQFRVAVQDPDGPLHSVAQLSQGAQDQLYLALRLAVADLMADEVRLPLLLDDPFVNCDDQRLERIRAALQELARDRQVLLLTHRELFGSWGTPVALAAAEAMA